MDDSSRNSLLKKIHCNIAELSKDLSAKEMLWIKKHLATPQIIEAVTDVEQTKSIRIWQITKNEDDENLAYFIGFNPLTHNYGIITQLSLDKKWYMGDYGTLLETFRAL